MSSYGLVAGHCRVRVGTFPQAIRLLHTYWRHLYLHDRLDRLLMRQSESCQGYMGNGWEHGLPPMPAVG